MDMKIKVFTAICTLPIWFGCAYEDPHVYFLRNQEIRIGTKLHSSNLVKRYQLVVTNKKENGNVEYHFKTAPKCTEIYEINPKTDIIVRASFEGSKKDCVQKP
jgi:hypothetical protein